MNKNFKTTLKLIELIELLNKNNYKYSIDIIDTNNFNILLNDYDQDINIFKNNYYLMIFKDSDIHHIKMTKKDLINIFN